MTKIEPVRLAFVGCGAITRTSNLPAALRSPWIRVHALVDLTVENASALKRQFALECEVARNLADVIDQVDGVFIATPNHTHRAVAEIALARGKPAMIEKPLTTTYADAAALCELAERNHTFISVGYRSRHWPGVKMLKHLLDVEYFGNIRSFYYECGNTGSWEAVSGYSVNRAQAGGGVLVDAHSIDKLIYWFGEPSQVQYADDSHGGVEANCKAQFFFDRPGYQYHGSLFLSKAIALKNKIVIEAEGGRCELEEKETADVAWWPKDRTELCLKIASSSPSSDSGRNDFQRQLEEFARKIRNQADLTVDGRFAARSVRLIEEMYRNRGKLAEPWVYPAEAHSAQATQRTTPGEVLVLT